LSGRPPFRGVTGSSSNPAAPGESAMSETERPFLPMSGELGGDFMSGMADSIRERRAREVPEREGVEEEKEEKKMRSTLLITVVVAITSTIGAVLSAEIHWLLVLEFGIAAGFAAGAGSVLLLIYQELRRLRR